MENFIFRKKRKMDEVKHKDKVKELQEKYIPFLDQIIRRLQSTEDGKSREAQLKKMQSLHDLLKNKPKTLKLEVLEKTEQVLKTLYQKFGPKKQSENTEDDDPNGSKTVALRPPMEVDRMPSQVDLAVVKQKLLHANEASMSREVDVRGNDVIDALKQKASAIIGDKVRPTDPRLERRAVTSEITLQFNKISTVISSRDNRNMFNARPDPVPSAGYPIPLANFQGGQQSVNLFCRRQDQTVYQQRGYAMPMNGPPNPSVAPPNPGPSRQICPQQRPDNPAMRADMNILNSPPLSNDDIESLMGGPSATPQTAGSTTTIRKSETVRFAVQYHQNPAKKSFDKSSSHLPIDQSGNITVSLDDPRLKKPLAPPRNDPRGDPRRDPRLKRNDPPPAQKTVSRYENRKPIDTRALEYKCNNPAPPKKIYNPMERRSELDDDYIDSSSYSAGKTTKNNLPERKKFDKLKAIESAPRVTQSCDSTQALTSQFDDMYRKNEFTEDYDKKVKTINKGIQSFKIPKKASTKSETENDGNSKVAAKESDKQSAPTKEKKREKSVEKTVEGKSKEPSEEKPKKKKKKKKQTENDSEDKEVSSKTKDSKKKDSSDSDETTKKKLRKRIVILSEPESENSDLDSETVLGERVPVMKTKSKKTKKAAAEKEAATKMKTVAVSEEKNEEDASQTAHRSQTATPEPVTSSSQVEITEKRETNESPCQTSPAEADASKDGITKEWLEGFLSNMFSPNSYTKNKLLDIMKTVLDDKKFEQVKSIFESEDDKTEDKGESSKEEKPKSDKVSEEKSDAVAQSSDQPRSDTPEDKPKRKKKTRELEALNEDIRTMFISEGVLTATGRRMCTALRRKPLCYNESTPPTSPTKELKNNEEELAASKPEPPVETKPLPGPKSKRGRKKKQPEEPNAQEAEVNVEISEKTYTGSDIARKFLEEKRLDINRLLKVELHKLNESEIAQSTTPKRKRKGGRKKVEDDSVSESSTPKKKKIRRNNIWFRNKNPKKRVKNPRSAGVSHPEEAPIETAELPEPPLKKKPGPKSKTQIITSPESKKSDSVTAAPMDINYSAIKKENSKGLFDIHIKNTDLTVTAVNQKACKICGYSGKTVVAHYVKAHPLHEVFCSRLPKNISDFLKKHESGMLYAESYNMKLQYSGSKIFGHCIFCRDEMYEPPSGWVTHFTKHTGEYEFVCTCGYKTWVAKMIRTHVKKCTERGSYVTNTISRDENKYIEAYICDECNYVQLQEENVRNHVITQHLTAPEVRKVCLLNFCDESVKKNHSIFLDMYKHNAAALEENQEEGVFKTTDEKDNEETTSKSILDDISKTIPNEPVSGIANKLHERFGEKPKIKVDVDQVVVKAEESANEEIACSESGASSQDTGSTDNRPVPMELDPPPNLDDNNDNPIEHDDDEWEDIESDSDESMQGLPGKPGQNKKLSRLAQKIGIKSGAKRKTDDAVESGSSKKSKTDVPAGSVTTTDAEPIITESPSEEGFESGKVENLLFKYVDGQPQYECLMKKCLYITSSMELFIDHLIRVHDEDDWSGYCHLCQEDKFLSPCTMVKEFHHLVNEHNWKNQPEKFSTTSDQIKEEARPAIRIRRLSGDKLSSQMNAFKVPTTPTHIRSVTIRRVSKSPEVSSASATTGSPPAAVTTQPGSPRVISTSGSLVIKRTLASGASSSSVSVGRLSDISTTEPLQTLKNIALSIPASQSTDNADVPKTKVYEGPMQSAKISGRRSTISADRPEPAFARVSNANDLKPWTKQQCSKSATTASKMLEQEVIYSPFKCMGSECWYFTSKENDMVSHLKSHDKTSEEQSEQTTVIDTCSWLECSYCDYMAGSTNDLMNHLKKEHLHCEFLCPKCFYRACHVNYVARHLLVYHRTDNATVWRIKPDYFVTTILNPVTCVKENVKLLTCKSCNLKFLNYIHFESHIKEHGSTMFECVFCLAMIRIENMKKHLFCHSIGNFECIYCECAMINKNNLAQHLCDKHPNKSLLYYNREQAQEHADKFKLSHFDNFSPKCVNVKFVKRDTIPKSIHKFPVGISVTRHTPAPQIASPNKDPPAADSSLPLVISNVVSLNTKPKPSPAPPSSFLVIKDVCTLPKETPSTAVAKPSGSTEPIKTPPTCSPPTESLENQGPFAKAMARVIADWVMKSGSSMKVLLKCSENNCDYQANGRGEFLEHVDRSHQNAMLKCPQCVNVFWHSSTSLWNHLETHGQKRYFCFACDFTARNEQLVAEHCTKIVHFWLGYITVLLTNVPEGGVYLLCPMNTSQAKIDTFKSNFVRNIQKNAVSSVADKRDAADTYGPDDIDKLPTKPVVARNIMCKLCNYKTMIVKNLVRHFDAHQQAVSLPRLDPVNPVPCLSEKNFDKMTNLACSSNMDRSKTNEPAFVVQQKRFVCGVSTCSYITIDDIMLRSHLSTLHSGETAYKCPHCSLELIKGVFSVEAIVAHYRLHGPKLFMCDKCPFMSETTVTVEKHIKGVHSGTGSIYILRDDSKNEAAVSELAVADESSLPKKWICSECKETTYLKCDMANHVATLHGHKYQYVCGYCSMGHPTRHYVEDHVKLRHGSTILITETYSAIKGGGSLKKHVESVNFWRRDDKGAKSIRGIPCEASEMPREDEEDEEESDEEFLPDRDTLVAVAKNVESELQKRKLEGSMFEDDTVAEQMKQQGVNRLIQCTICGKTTLSALTMQIVHFPDCHPGLPVTTRTIMSSGKVEEPKQKPKESTLDFSGYMFKCFYCSLAVNTMEEFKFHYVGEHGDEPESPRCLFFAIKTMYCGLCQEVCDSYDVVAKHLLEVHKTDSVIAKNAKDSMICGACNYNAGDDQNLLRHAKLRHTNPLGSNSTAKHAVTQTVLEQLLQIKMYPMKRCSVCREVICDIDGSQIEEHLRMKHSASMIATFVGIHNFSLICSVCDDMFESETVALTHILTHVKSFKCSICNEFYYTYENTEKHMNEKHNGDASKILFAWPTDVILQTLILFPNGLIMSLGELQLTKYGFNPTKYKMVRSEVMIVRHLKITNSELVT